MSRCWPVFCLLVVSAACLPLVPVPSASPAVGLPAGTVSPTPFLPAPASPSPLPTSTPSPTPSPTSTPKPLVPDFTYIVFIAFENKEYGTVIGNTKMPNYNRFAQEYTLLNQHYAVIHPSLPNYLAMMGGDTFGVTSNCEDCFINARSLPDEIEASGRTWKTYQESMPKPCFVGSRGKYAQKHNPFIYFDPIRLDTARCERSIVPLTQLDADLAANALPNFFFIMPNLCNSAHDSDCPLYVADAWLGALMHKLLPVLEASQQPYLVVLTWDEGQTKDSCCGLPAEAGGRIPTVLVSPQVKNGFQDDTPYTLYSLLKTVAKAWGLAYLGRAVDFNNALILAPWK